MYTGGVKQVNDQLGSIALAVTANSINHGINTHYAIFRKIPDAVVGVYYSRTRNGAAYNFNSKRAAAVNYAVNYVNEGICVVEQR